MLPDWGAVLVEITGVTVVLASPVGRLVAAMVPGHNRNCSLDHQSLGFALVTYMPLKLLYDKSTNKYIYLMHSFEMCNPQGQACAVIGTCSHRHMQLYPLR